VSGRIRIRICLRRERDVVTFAGLGNSPACNKELRDWLIATIISIAISIARQANVALPDKTNQQPSGRTIGPTNRRNPT